MLYGFLDTSSEPPDVFVQAEALDDATAEAGFEGNDDDGVDACVGRLLSLGA